MENNSLRIFVVVVLAVVTFVVGGSVLTYYLVADRREDDQSTPEFNAQQAALVEPSVNRFCGSCHPTPSPDDFPKNDWFEEVEQGFDFYTKSGRTDLELPNLADIASYYQFHAPTEHEYLDRAVTSQPSDTPSPFVELSPNRDDVSDRYGTAHLNWTSLDQDSEPVLIYCDMGSGQIGIIDPLNPSLAPTVVATLESPAHVEVCDLDGDGLTDLVVADLGSVRATDDLCGSVVWLRRVSGDLQFEAITIATDIGRTCDVRPGDLDDDGDQDLVVAEFGWQRSGSIFVLENRGADSGEIEFEKRTMDSRHGAVAVQIVDINSDGRLDFLGLVSQEYEALDLFLNEGDWEFTSTNLYSGPGPSYGSSGFEVVDLDLDNDLDVLYVNGDSFDSDLIKPYHGIQWLENDGDLGFEHRMIAQMPGVHRATPGDVDGDGDLDIVASSLLPFEMDIDRSKTVFDSVLLLVNQGDQTFERRSIEAGDYAHPTSVLADFDGDSDLDLAVGVVAISSTAKEVPHILTWINQSREETVAVNAAHDSEQD